MKKISMTRFFCLDRKIGGSYIRAGKIGGS